MASLFEIYVYVVLLPKNEILLYSGLSTKWPWPVVHYCFQIELEFRNVVEEGKPENQAKNPVRDKDENEQQNLKKLLLSAYNSPDHG